MRMAEMIHQVPDPVLSREGVAYVAQAWTECDGGWHGWLVFIAADGRIMRTALETSQATRAAIREWAAALRPEDLDHALARAFPPSAERPAA
jgi:hypothetical protein